MYSKYYAVYSTNIYLAIKSFLCLLACDPKTSMKANTNFTVVMIAHPQCFACVHKLGAAGLRWRAGQF